MESFTVTWEPINETEDQAFRDFIYGKLKKEPESCIEPLVKQIKKHPTDPTLYNHLYLCYAMTGRLWEARDLLLKTTKLFPDYLFGLVEYASYLLHRGDYEKIPEVFKNCRTLKQLYPNRDVFHISEVIVFHYIMGLYFLEVEDITQSKVYLSILEKFDDACDKAESLRDKIAGYIRRQAFNKLLPKGKCSDTPLRGVSEHFSGEL